MILGLYHNIIFDRVFFEYEQKGEYNLLVLRQNLQFSRSVVHTRVFVYVLFTGCAIARSTAQNAFPPRSQFPSFYFVQLVTVFCHKVSYLIGFDVKIA